MSADKSHVSIEQNVCQVCGITFDTGSILLDKRIRNTMERETVTGMGLCSEHQKLFEAGFVALVEIDPKRSGLKGCGNETTLKSENAWRTGRMAHLRRAVFVAMINIRIDDKCPVIFVEAGVIDALQAIIASEADVASPPSVH